MKASRKIIAMLLVVMSLISCIGVSAFADSEKRVRQYGAEGGYLAIGDSIARGMSATPDNYAETHNFYDRTVEGSYPYLVAQAVGCNIKDDARDRDSNFWPVCFHGQTLAMTMDLLGIEDNYYDDVYAHGTGPLAYHYYPIMQELYGNADELLKSASLITLGFGLADVFYRALIVAQINNPEINADFVEDILAGIAEGYDYWLKAYPMLLDYIKVNNPDATVVLVGNYNVGGDIPVTNDILIPVGMAASVFTGYMNSAVKQWAEDYGYIYCDITNAETVAAQGDIGLVEIASDDIAIYTHLSPEGNALVARNIINALPYDDGTSKQVTTDITVDLGRFKRVSYVMLDGRLLSKNAYSMDGYELTIPYRCKNAKNLTVAVVGENGKTTINTYQLSFDAKSGYNSYLIYGVNDAASAVKAIVSQTSSILNSITSSIFKK